MEDVYVETGTTGLSSANHHLNGTLTIVSCEAVTVKNVSLRCGPGAERLAACLTVRAERLAACLTVRDERAETILGLARCHVRVLHCNFEVGHQQTGILLVNVGRSVVDNNSLRVAARPQSLTLSALAANLPLRARVRRLLLSHLRLGHVPGAFRLELSTSIWAIGQSAFELIPLSPTPGSPSWRPILLHPEHLGPC